MRKGCKQGVEPIGFGIGQSHVGAAYTADEVQFMRAVERHQKKTGRKFLTHVEYLRIAESLGYRRAAPEGAK